MTATKTDAEITGVEAIAYVIPTETPESDGTLAWDRTTLVVCEVAAAGKVGLGYTYCDRSAAVLIRDKLATLLVRHDALATRACWEAMLAATRNLGRPGIVSCAIAAVDSALYDLKGKLLDAPVVTILGAARGEVAVYGSGGFTSYSDQKLQDQLAGWIDEGIAAVKMKVGRQPARDADRVRLARSAIGSGGELFVDANGAYSRKQAMAFAETFGSFGVTWFEEPVSSDDLEGLALIRDRGPAGMEITAGEYGYDAPYFRRMLDHGAVDVLQADATRCAGITGFMIADALCHAAGIPLSSHTAPALHLHACCAAHRLRHMEWFFDHVRIESMLFDGAPVLERGRVRPDLSRPGLGIALKRQDAERFRQ